MRGSGHRLLFIAPYKERSTHTCEHFAEQRYCNYAVQGPQPHTAGL